MLKKNLKLIFFRKSKKKKKNDEREMELFIKLWHEKI
jgi:aldehyde:ferredoxin oxidoreductase